MDDVSRQVVGSVGDEDNGDPVGEGGQGIPAERISLLMRMLAGQEAWLEFDPTVFTAFVEKVVVSGTKKDVRLSFVLGGWAEYSDWS